MTQNRYLHPDDMQTFLDVSNAMRRVAKKYNLKLKSIELEPDPEYKTSHLGLCSSEGDITLVLRGKTDGVWDTVPRDRKSVWDTGAHELAHLRHFNHGLAFQEFEEELMLAMQNEDVDPTQKIIDKLQKLKKSRDGEEKLGNSAAAEAFASTINRLLIEHELQPSDLDYEAIEGKEPIIELKADLARFQIRKSGTRIAWQESLASIVANAHLCKILIKTSSNSVWFVGTKTHATIAEYAYGTLVPAAALLSEKEAYYYKLEMNRAKTPHLAHGFRESWLVAFVQRIRERMQEAREDTVRHDAERRAARGEAGSTSTALVRLKDAMVRVDKYVDDKFKRKRSYAGALNGGSSGHAEGRARGRAAADSISIGRKGVGSSAKKGLLS